MKDGRPDKYEVEFNATYGGSGENFDRYLVKGLKKIEFAKPIEDYRWIWHKHGVVSPTIPFIFKKKSWYILGRLYEGGTPSVLIFIYVKDDGTFLTFRKDKATNF